MVYLLKTILTSISSVKAGKALMLSSAAFFSAMVSWLSGPVPDWGAIIVSVTGVLVVLVSLYTVISNAKNDTAKVLQGVIDGLRSDLEKERANTSKEKDSYLTEIAALKGTITGLTESIARLNAMLIENRSKPTQ